MVFQSYALFPHMTVARERRLRPGDAQARQGGDRDARRARRCAWSGSKPRRAPAAPALRRPAAARRARPRARRSGPTCCCSTSRSPISTPSCAQEVRIEIRELQRKLGLTTIMVTHDQEEALTMADRLVVMAEGEIRQIGSQRDLYERPTDRFVAGFVGRSTFLRARERAGSFEMPAGGIFTACTRRNGRVGALPLRPESIERSARSAAWTTGPSGQGGIRLLSRRGARDACAHFRPPIASWCSLPNRRRCGAERRRQRRGRAGSATPESCFGEGLNGRGAGGR